MARMELESIEVVSDLTRKSRCDEGFLRLARLRLRNHYRDGSASAVYPCDVVSRRHTDAVVCLLYEVVDTCDEGRSVQVVLREAPRPPVYLRRSKELVHPDPRAYDTLREFVAGVIEESDADPDGNPDGNPEAGLQRRAALEALEEAGLDVPPERFTVVGAGTFASPGVGDEKVHYVAAPVRVADAREPAGDGSVMEECARVVVMELGAALAACRAGEIPDMKTELGLQRLAEHTGYVPALGCFADELPSGLRERQRGLGLAVRS
jgi:ADP-ribose pyrophosphatase